MEMPELNEEIMEGDSETTAEQSAQPAELDESAIAAAVAEPEGGAEPIEQAEDETMDSSDIPKGEDEVPQETADGSLQEEEREISDEPEVKKIKLEEEQPSQPQPEEPEEAKPSEEPSNKPDTDMLSTLASAALNQDEKEEKTDVPPTPSKEEVVSSKKRTEQWHNIGVFENNTTIVTDYVAVPELSDEIFDASSIVLGGKRVPLEPGTAYKLRVCAMNACGPGPWSEVAAFKTTLPGFPGAPSAIKISKSSDGAHLTWEPPGGNSGEILEYAVYLAVRSASQGSQPVNTTQAQLAFVRVFCGPTNKCVVGPTSLQAAHIDTTTKPAIIFRIAARNAKGYGPATQVRWLQESAGIHPGTPTGKRAAKV